MWESCVFYEGVRYMDTLSHVCECMLSVCVIVNHVCPRSVCGLCVSYE